MGEPEKKTMKGSFVREDEAENMTNENTANELLKKSPLERLVVAMEQEVVELKSIRKSVEELVNVFKNAAPTETKSIPTQPKPINPSKSEDVAFRDEKKAEPQQSSPVQEKINRIKTALGNDLSAMIEFDTTTSSNMIHVKPKRFLGGDNFNALMTIIRENGGKYVSAGKNSHFEVPKLV